MQLKIKLPRFTTGQGDDTAPVGFERTRVGKIGCRFESRDVTVFQSPGMLPLRKTGQLCDVVAKADSTICRRIF